MGWKVFLLKTPPTPLTPHHAAHPSTPLTPYIHVGKVLGLCAGNG